MARFLVTVDFTRNGVAGEGTWAVPAALAANATAAMNLAVPVATAWIEKISSDVVVIGATSVVAAS
jgi:hypothetical protein